jgi:hypothetical protein
MRVSETESAGVLIIAGLREGSGANDLAARGCGGDYGYFTTAITASSSLVRR